MILGCKIGCLCSDINKDYCCRECDNHSNCESACDWLNYISSREGILKSCDDSYLVNE